MPRKNGNRTEEPLEKQPPGNLDASLWKAPDKLRKNIDARNFGHLINRRTRELSKEDIDKIASTYHSWKNSPPFEGVVEDLGVYKNIPGFCASAPISKVRELDYALTPGRYVGLPAEKDDFIFAGRFASLKAELEAQLTEEAQLNALISNSLSMINLNSNSK